jgi:quinol-cytochrome oxidoreductase complex cytochrome b subunit
MKGIEVGRNSNTIILQIHISILDTNTENNFENREKKEKKEMRRRREREGGRKKETKKKVPWRLERDNLAPY